MSLTRKEFIRLMGGAAAALAFPSVLALGCKRAIQKAAERVPIIWIQALSCAGCSVSLMDRQYPDLLSLITGHFSLNFHQTVMGGTGDRALQVLAESVERERRDFILVVEGAVPAGSDEFCSVGRIDGRRIGAREWIEKLGRVARAVVAVGTCSSFGGIAAARPRDGGDNPTGAAGIGTLFTGRRIIRVPGCPPHPDWMAGTLLHLVLNGMPKLDEYDRPLLYYGRTVHDMCERRLDYRAGRFARTWGDDGCLYHLGCLGMDSNCDIPERKWQGVNTCTGCGAGCIGCTEDAFPDYGARGLFLLSDTQKDSGPE